MWKCKSCGGKIINYEKAIYEIELDKNKNTYKSSEQWCNEFSHVKCSNCLIKESYDCMENIAEWEV